MSQPRQITIADVAQASGVSHQTVSRVINAHPHVAKGTRERVLATIRQLGYRPNRMAQGLAGRRSQTIGVISFGLGYFGPAQTLAQIERAIQARGYGLAFTSVAALNVSALQRALDELSRARVDGVVVTAPVIGLSAAQVSSLRQQVPMVMTDVQPEAKLPSVVVDQREGARLATQHLLELGHTRLAQVSGPLDWNAAALRQEGWRATLTRAGLTPGPSAASDWTARGGYEAARALLDAGAAFSALVVGNDQMALGAVRALFERGLRVPADVSVVGFDDIPEAAFFSPPLTTVSQDFGAMGQQSVDYLLALIGDPSTPGHQRVLYPQLVVRSSTAPPPGAGSPSPA